MVTRAAVNLNGVCQGELAGMSARSLRDEGVDPSPPRAMATLEWSEIASGYVGPGAGSVKPYWRVTSLRTGRVFWARSEHQRDALIVLDADPAVTDFRLRPVLVHYVSEGVQHVAQPEFMVCRGLQRQFWLVFDDQIKSDVARQCALQDQLGALGYGLAELVWAELLTDSTLEVSCCVRTLSVRRVDAATEGLVRQEIGTNGDASWADVVGGVHAKLAPGIVCRLLFEGVLRLSPAGRLRPDTRVVLNELPSEAE